MLGCFFKFCLNLFELLLSLFVTFPCGRLDPPKKWATTEKKKEAIQNAVAAQSESVWNFYQERELLEKLFTERFNFFLVVFGAILAGTLSLYTAFHSPDKEANNPPAAEANVAVETAEAPTVAKSTDDASPVKTTWADACCNCCRNFGRLCLAQLHKAVFIGLQLAGLMLLYTIWLPLYQTYIKLITAQTILTAMCDNKQPLSFINNQIEHFGYDEKKEKYMEQHPKNENESKGDYNNRVDKAVGKVHYLSYYDKRINRFYGYVIPWGCIITMAVLLVISIIIEFSLFG